FATDIKASLVALTLAQSRTQCPAAKCRHHRCRSTETTPHECRLIAGERTERLYVRHDAFDAEPDCLAARPASMLWPSAAAHGPPELGGLPPPLTRGPNTTATMCLSSRRTDDVRL